LDSIIKPSDDLSPSVNTPGSYVRGASVSVASVGVGVKATGGVTGDDGSGAETGLLSSVGKSISPVPSNVGASEGESTGATGEETGDKMGLMFSVGISASTGSSDVGASSAGEGDGVMGIISSVGITVPAGSSVVGEVFSVGGGVKVTGVVTGDESGAETGLISSVGISI
jgi:hypothetical protein